MIYSLLSLRGRKLVAKWFEELSHGGLVAVLFDVGPFLWQPNQPSSLPPACVCAESPGERKLRTQDSVNASISRPGGLHWRFLGDINAIQFTLSVFNSGTKEMLRNGPIRSMLPKKGGGGSKTLPTYYLYTILTWQKGNTCGNTSSVPLSIHAISGKMQEADFSLFFFNAQTTPI